MGSLLPKLLLVKSSGKTLHALHGVSATRVVPASPTLSTLSACLEQEQVSRFLMSSRRHAAPAAAAASASFPQVVSEQGGGVGGEIVAASDEACKVACRGDPNCKSFVYCPGWGKCWMKDRQLNGTESTGPQSDCRTYYETEFCS